MARRARAPKARITIMLDRDVLGAFKAHAARPDAIPYQTQINQALRGHVEALRLAEGFAGYAATAGRSPARRHRARGSKARSTIQRTINAVIRAGERSGYVAECLELPIVTQGTTLDQVARHLREAIALHLEGEDCEALGLAPDPTIVVMLELTPAHA